MHNKTLDAEFVALLEASKKRCEEYAARTKASCRVELRGNQRGLGQSVVYLEDAPDRVRMIEGDTGRQFKIGSGS
jgi:hypothetical protein